jgi:hypothetical protein
VGCAAPDDEAGGLPATDVATTGALLDSVAAVHGGDVLDRAVVRFTFRGEDFRLRHDGGRFLYRRSYVDSMGRAVEEGLGNDTLYRAVEGRPVSLTEEKRASVRTAVNSVAYFALLPSPLTDPAVQARHTGIDTVAGVPYHRVRVTFRQQGGGDDWQDVFMYWFHEDDLAMDYLAYAYGLAPGDEDTGTRFREAYNVRRVNGVRVADYMNYTSDTLSVNALGQYPDLLEADALRLVSRVEIDSVRVQPLGE